MDYAAAKAAVRAGYAPRGARQRAHEVLNRPDVQAEIARLATRIAEKVAVTAEDVLRHFWLIATADPRELIEYRRTCCRYCHGAGFGYQRTPAELARAQAGFEAAQTKRSNEQFDEQGGGGYVGTRPPRPDCPECFGEGVERVFVHDTRTLSPAAARLYAGVKTTKDGLEVKMHDQQVALAHVGRYLGMFTEKDPPVDPESTARRVRDALRAMDVANGR